ncbi:2472_t:CDS:2 [Funneliformis geosporum]|uniref:2472_t:CDS:1 n=1 Tax=Funneliformis geosporum TaxID=1117311 RepID=A0A9W4SGB0_9GLOM|nr:2472_t:CDS:2 [Funneliformis geosporum]
MLLETKKRTRVSDEESDHNESGEGFGGAMIDGRNNYKEKAGKVDLKRMRLDLDHEDLRVVPSELFNSSSESSPRTPSSHSTHADTTDFTSSPYSYHQILQQQQQSTLGGTSLLNPNFHKLHRNPIRISTRSDASSSSSTELLNPYMNINSVLYLANLTRTSHIVNELQDDLGCMEIDERIAGSNHNERRHGTSSSAMENVGSLDQELTHDLHYRFQNREYVNEGSSDVSDYQSINAILREAFLRRHQH